MKKAEAVREEGEPADELSAGVGVPVATALASCLLAALALAA